MLHPETCECRDISHFLDGIQRFKARFYDSAVPAAAKAQTPATLMISCSDSHVEPALLLGAEPGELFMVRNIAGLVLPYVYGGGPNSTGAAIEYAVRDLKVDHIVVLGHAHCTGIKALLDTAMGFKPPRDFVGNWVETALAACRHIVPAADGADPEREVPVEHLLQNPDVVERATVVGSLENLLSYPWIHERVDAGRLQLHGWWFDVETGDLWKTEPNGTQLLPVL